MDKEVSAIDRIWILTLYGEKAERFDTPQEAVRYLQASPDEKTGHLVRIRRTCCGCDHYAGPGIVAPLRLRLEELP